MPQITTNTITRRTDSQTVASADEYIVSPATFAVLWKEITGRATVTDEDLAHIRALCMFFESGLAITRNNRSAGAGA